MIYRFEIVVNVVVESRFLGRLDELGNYDLKGDLQDSLHQCGDEDVETHFQRFLRDGIASHSESVIQGVVDGDCWARCIGGDLEIIEI